MAPGVNAGSLQRFFLSALISLFAAVAKCEDVQTELSPIARAAIESAVVRVSLEDGRFFATGVLISEDGTIVMRIFHRLTRTTRPRW